MLSMFISKENQTRVLTDNYKSMFAKDHNFIQSVITM